MKYDEKSMKEAWEKEVWKTEGYNVYNYDAEDKLLSSWHMPCQFTVIFESKEKNAVFIHDNLNWDPDTFQYSHENNNLTFDLMFPLIIKESLKCKIIETTDSEMVWKEEYDVNDAAYYYYKRKPDKGLEAIKEKVVLITKLSKVKRNGEETSIKGLWKTKGYERDYYDVEGKLMYHDFYKKPFSLYIDDKYITYIKKKNMKDII